jgi:hypothetical protein
MFEEVDIDHEVTIFPKLINNILRLSAIAVEPTFRDTCSTTRNKAQMEPSSKLFLTEYNVTLGTDINIRLRYV